ncbi:hypothetical protein UFOVP223_63 [uncultured Caudovirales phage]|uniref:Uncharacterized protein n=1 Tax=uncultured Caudovirales phage TaxID=2100421 RepID=A0A6J5L7X7_9CAUD|nr:hypothetical protein UFOVP110_101 [uncultured Caudovirales phage]CAB5219359.1 hypothetical protein UFOVP223_63 [uncultured Caudovirales phage]
MKQQRKNTDRISGSYGGPRGRYGNTLEGNAALTSGTTYGGQGLGNYWQLYPSMIGGLTDYNYQALQPGSNLSALQYSSPQQGSEVVALEAGMADGILTGSSVGGTAAY